MSYNWIDWIKKQTSIIINIKYSKKSAKMSGGGEIKSSNSNLKMGGHDNKKKLINEGPKEEEKDGDQGSLIDNSIDYKMDKDNWIVFENTLINKEKSAFKPYWSRK